MSQFGDFCVSTLGGAVGGPLIEVVASTYNTGTGTSYTVDTSGLGLLQYDMLVVITGSAVTGSIAPTCTGDQSGAYVGAGAHVYANDNTDTNFRMFVQQMGATPDDTLTITRGGTSTRGGGTAVLVLRGASSTLDATGTAVGISNGTRADPPAVSPSTAGAIIVAGGASGYNNNTGTAFTVPSGMVEVVSQVADGSTSDCIFWLAYAYWVSGTYDPPAVTGGSSDAFSSGAAQTIALKPA